MEEKMVPICLQCGLPLIRFCIGGVLINRVDHAVAPRVVSHPAIVQEVPSGHAPW